MKRLGVVLALALLTGCGVSPATMSSDRAPNAAMSTAAMPSGGTMMTMSATSSAACAASMGVTPEAMTSMMASGSMMGATQAHGH